MKVLDYLIKLIIFLYKLLIWAFRLWPLWAMVAIIGIQCLFLNYFPSSHAFIYKIIVLYSQIIGGIIVLVSINLNISVINKGTYMSLFASFWSERPRFNLPIITASMNGSVGNDTVSARGEVLINHKNIEEKVEYLLNQLSIIKTTIDRNLQATDNKINKLDVALHEKITNTELDLRVLSTKLTDISIGGLGFQFFGLMLMVNGAIASF